MNYEPLRVLSVLLVPLNSKIRKAQIWMGDSRKLAPRERQHRRAQVGHLVLKSAKTTSYLLQKATQVVITTKSDALDWLPPHSCETAQLHTSTDWMRYLFLWSAPLSFDWSPYLRLTCGPAGSRTTTGSLSASSRTTPYQLLHRDTLRIGPLPALCGYRQVDSLAW